MVCKRGVKMGGETVTSICGICPGGCGVNVKLIDGKIEKILPIKSHPIGVVCVRGVHSKEIVYSNDRLRYPLLRVGERGEGRFERIGWDGALDRIVDKNPGPREPPCSCIQDLNTATAVYKTSGPCQAFGSSQTT
jgi:anaerobic selenocysteine-containing dehydrogenase